MSNIRTQFTLIGMAVFLGMVACLSACGSSASLSVPSSTPTTTTTAPVPTASPTLVAGVCRASDFPPPIRQKPNPPTGGDPGPFYGAPISDFQFPPGTYYYDHGKVTGSQYWAMCSPGDPASILAFMRQSITNSAWTIISMPAAEPLSLDAQKPATTATPGGTSTPMYCSTLDVTVGGFVGYPGEWSFTVYAPATLCQ